MLSGRTWHAALLHPGLTIHCSLRLRSTPGQPEPREPAPGNRLMLDEVSSAVSKAQGVPFAGIPAKLVGWKLGAPGKGAFRAPERPPAARCFPQGQGILTSALLNELKHSVLRCAQAAADVIMNSGTPQAFFCRSASRARSAPGLLDS
jgi:hypothetical protein